MSNGKQQENPSYEVAQTQANQITAILLGGGETPFASFDLSTNEGASLLVKATLNELPKLKSMINKQIAVKHFYTHMVDGEPDDNGIIRPFRRIVLFDNEGNGYTCGSRGVGKALGVFLSIRQRLPFDPPIRCEVTLTDIGEGRQWLSLKPIPTDLVLPKRK